MKLSYKKTGIVSEKDTKSVIIECNNVFVEYAGVKSEDDILGRTDCDFPWQQYADIYRAHELDALAGNNYSTIIPLKTSRGDDLLFLHTKIGKTDDTGAIIGVSCHAIEILNQDAHKLSKMLEVQTTPKSPVYSLGKKLSSESLPKRQREILFFLSRGKSPKQIAAFFNLSVRTIEYYIDIMRQKFGCRTRWELIETAMSQGYCDAIPTNTPFSELIKMITI
jgi:DNA-binding CsgD family transcriptional regulator